NVDQHAFGAKGDDLAGEIFFKGSSKTIVHVDLDGDKQRMSELEDRNTVHCHSPLSAAGLAFASSDFADLIFTTARLVRRSATANASARVAFETTLRSTPK